MSHSRVVCERLGFCRGRFESDMGCKFKLEFTLQRGRNKLKPGLQQRFFLRGKQFADARLAERKQIGKLRLGERGLLAGAFCLRSARRASATCLPRRKKRCWSPGFSLFRPR